MTISLIIPAYNEEKYLPDCLESVHAHGAGLFEIIVVNNASTDGTVHVAQSFPGVRVVTENAKGLTKARQCGLREAKGDILAYIDADTKMPAGWVEPIERAFAGNERFVCVSGPYIYYDLPFTKKHLVRLWWLILAYPTYLVSRFMVVGGNFAAKKSALLAIGGFDTTISFYGEDTDIARRLHNVGKVKFMPSFFMYTSARRLAGDGFFMTAARYFANYLSIAILKRPVTGEYRDIR